MDLPRSARVAGRLIARESSPSTNAELVGLAAVDDLPDLTALVTLEQTAGRGRLDRVWTAPPGTSLAISVLLRTVDPVGRPVAFDRLSWLPIAGGVAMTETIAELLPHAGVGLKWPNDVLIGDRKVCGVLTELVPATAGGTGAVVIGAGVNLTMSAEQLPVPTATSLVIEGAAAEPGSLDADLADRVLADYLARLRSHVSALLTAHGDAEGSGLRARARELCGTLGGQVRVELPDGTSRVGTARDLDLLGRLVVATEHSDLVVAAGDVIHLRHG
ncbi:biotin--[acetyl-CoA-carboxylase] ligase [Schumannella sp. 10F1B-5-1]|uniref:biotin--[acetyl-CoA-carboxylase] ligase n=1 Tax=Schumannella sp. 10F1B-5-1 TaxID=2590780 RepID=UPI0011314E26|nr:biotin--[acetyl-CoA-carboxylase] ligase [Schumannella sp. 10F1B-5-1]TPW73553.1 biotin--[acetyl-CoA-carboxylase] ligase [Schumannella sp. 10F1B-5-1]